MGPVGSPSVISAPGGLPVRQTGHEPPGGFVGDMHGSARQPKVRADPGGSTPSTTRHFLPTPRNGPGEPLERTARAVRASDSPAAQPRRAALRAPTSPAAAFPFARGHRASAGRSAYRETHYLKKHPARPARHDSVTRLEAMLDLLQSLALALRVQHHDQAYVAPKAPNRWTARGLPLLGAPGDTWTSFMIR